MKKSNSENAIPIVAAIIAIMLAVLFAGCNRGGSQPFASVSSDLNNARSDQPVIMAVDSAVVESSSGWHRWEIKIRGDVYVVAADSATIREIFRLIHE